MLISFCDLVVGLYLLMIAIKDAVVANHYAQSDILWRSSIPCYVIAFVSLLSILIEALFLLTVSIARYRVVKDPFEKPFSTRITYFVMLFLPLVFAIIISVAITLRTKVERMPYLSSPMPNAH